MSYQHYSANASGRIVNSIYSIPYHVNIHYGDYQRCLNANSETNNIPKYLGRNGDDVSICTLGGGGTSKTDKHAKVEESKFAEYYSAPYDILLFQVIILLLYMTSFYLIIPILSLLSSQFLLTNLTIMCI